MVLDSVEFSGHVLIVGVPPSLEALLWLVAPFRSRRLPTWTPIVIMDSGAPAAGTAWDDIARFHDVYYLEVRLWRSFNLRLRWRVVASPEHRVLLATSTNTHCATPSPNNKHTNKNKGSVLSSDDLLRANAEAAAQILLLPAHASAHDDDEEAAFEKTAMQGVGGCCAPLFVCWCLGEGL